MFKIIFGETTESFSIEGHDWEVVQVTENLCVASNGEDSLYIFFSYKMEYSTSVSATWVPCDCDINVFEPRSYDYEEEGEFGAETLQKIQNDINKWIENWYEEY